MMTGRILALAALCLAAAAQTQQATPQRLEEQVQAYNRAGLFNGTALVAVDGATLLNKGYGLANREWMIPNTPETKFRLGSITKQFTAMAVLLLEQQGKLKVEDPVCKYLEACPDAWKPVTVHHLLTHTSGIPNFTSFPDYTKTMMIPSPPAETLKRVTGRPLDFAPGTQMRYSNSGYVVLGYIIEKASGQGYTAYLKKNVLDPLGLADTGYDDTSTVLERRASGYEKKGAAVVNAPYLDMTIPHAAGSMYSTTLDLMKWDAALNTGKLLTPENYKRYFTPALKNYAYGWIVQESAGVEVHSHGGGINGFATMIYRVPSRKLVVVTLSNVTPSKAGDLANDLFRLAMGRSVDLPKPAEAVKPPAETLKKYTGEYELSPAFILTVTLEGDTLITQATGQGKFAVYPKSETTFSPREFEAELTFENDESGSVTGLVLNQGGRRLAAKKVK